MTSRALILTFMALTALHIHAAEPTVDWAKHNRYAQANDSLTKAPDAVFIGNSITDFWYRLRPQFFESHNFACRGISGQVTAQMLCRFKADVIDLYPKVVVISGGINDLVGNNGPIDIPHIVDNIESMVDLALAHGIIPIVATPLPTNYASWKPQLQDLAQLVADFNQALTGMCRTRSVAIIDYYTPLLAGPSDPGAINPLYSDDRLHPNAQAYARILEPAALAILTPLLSIEH